jgi:hypothetical protein
VPLVERFILHSYPLVKRLVLFRPILFAGQKLKIGELVCLLLKSFSLLGIYPSSDRGFCIKKGGMGA